MTIISASLKTHDDNKQTTRNLLIQKEELSNGDTVSTVTGQIKIDFSADGGGVSTFTVKRVISDEAAIPGNKNILEITDFEIIP